MTKRTYGEKLKDPRWQQKRLMILDRDKWECTECGDTTLTKHVHHKKYGSGEPWEIDDKFLCTLCDECHLLEESLKETNPELKHYALLGNITCIRLWKWIKTVSFLSSEHPDDYKNLAEFGNKNILAKFGKQVWYHGSGKKVPTDGEAIH